MPTTSAKKPGSETTPTKATVESILAGLEREAFVPDLERVGTHEDLADEEEGITVGKDDVTRSKLGGAPYLSEKAPHPRCAACEEPMKLVVQVRRSDLPALWQASVAQELVQVFWCGSCHGDNEEAFSPGTLVREVAMSDPAIAPAPPTADEDADDEGEVISFINGWQPKADFPSCLSDELRFMKVGKALANKVLESPPDGEVLDGVKLSTWRRWESAPAVVKCECKLPMSWWLHLSDLGPTIGDGHSMGVLSCTCGRKALRAD